MLFLKEDRYGQDINIGISVTAARRFLGITPKYPQARSIIEKVLDDIRKNILSDNPT